MPGEMGSLQGLHPEAQEVHGMSYDLLSFLGVRPVLPRTEGEFDALASTSWSHLDRRSIRSSFELIKHVRWLEFMVIRDILSQSPETSVQIYQKQQELFKAGLDPNEVREGDERIGIYPNALPVSRMNITEDDRQLAYEFLLGKDKKEGILHKKNGVTLRQRMNHILEENKFLCGQFSREKLLIFDRADSRIYSHIAHAMRRDSLEDLLAYAEKDYADAVMYGVGNVTRASFLDSFVLSSEMDTYHALPPIREWAQAVFSVNVTKANVAVQDDQGRDRSKEELFEEWWKGRGVRSWKRARVEQEKNWHKKHQEEELEQGEGGALHMLSEKPKEALLARVLLWELIATAEDRIRPDEAGTRKERHEEGGIDLMKDAELRNAMRKLLADKKYRNEVLCLTKGEFSLVSSAFRGLRILNPIS